MTPSKSNTKDRNVIKNNRSNCEQNVTRNNAKNSNKNVTKKNSNKVSDNDCPPSGSKIPLYVAHSKSSPNVTGLNDELPESVRRDHQQHLAGRHTQRPKSSYLIDDLIIATSSMNVTERSNLSVPFHQSRSSGSSHNFGAPPGFARNNRTQQRQFAANSSGIRTTVFQNESSSRYIYDPMSEYLNSTPTQIKFNGNQILNDLIQNGSSRKMDEDWRAQNGAQKERPKKFRKPRLNKNNEETLNNTEASSHPEPSKQGDVKQSTGPVQKSNPSILEQASIIIGRRRNQRKTATKSEKNIPEVSDNHDISSNGNVSNRKDNRKDNDSNRAAVKTSGQNRNNERQRTNGGPESNSESKPRFAEYLPLCELQEGLKKGEVVEGILRINPKNARDSYISASEDGLDILINNYNDRNRALNGDKVLIKFHPEDKWSIQYSVINAKWSEFESSFDQILVGKNVDQLNLENLKLNTSELKRVTNATLNKTELKAAIAIEFPNIPPEVFCLSAKDLCKVTEWKQFVQRTGYVVKITEYNHSRITGGTLQLIKSTAFYKCSSADKRIPDIYIPKSKLPANFSTTHNSNQLFLVKIVEWNTKDYFPSGEIFDDLGLRGEIEAELQIILRSNEIDTSDFPENILAGTGFEAVDWKIPQEEIQKRKDYRQHCLFTIDPSTAKDLDDAISLKDLGQGRFEVGVHIADVSYFIREDSLLDEIASRRATSVYLPDRVIPMLPHQFCQNLCSLNPGEDKLAFSTVFIMNDQGIVESHWIGRTIINSCSKLSYENAQKLIDGDKIDEEDFPKIYNNWKVDHLRKQVIILNKIAKAIRKRRFETGSVRIDKSKLAFVLDDDQYPIGFAKYVFYDSNRLIEELMLLSNRTVAEHIYNRFSGDGRAFLRRHPPPDQNVLGKFKQYCSVLGLGFDTSSSLNIHKSLELVEKKNKDLFRWISFQLIRAMKLAQYTTVARQDSILYFKHYALNFQYYTHFTSPIRRYADLIVHRLLSQDFHYEGACTKSSTALRDYAVNCNKQKQNAFLVSEDSSKVFMKAHIQKLGTMCTNGIVCEVFEKSVEVLLIDFDIPVRVYIDKMPIENVYYSKENGFPNLKIVWNKADNNSTQKQTLIQNLTVTSLVPILLSINDKFELHAVIPTPNSSSAQIPTLSGNVTTSGDFDAQIFENIDA